MADEKEAPKNEIEVERSYIVFDIDKAAGIVDHPYKKANYNDLCKTRTQLDDDLNSGQQPRATDQFFYYTGTTVPTFAATQGAFYWQKTNKLLYINTDGSTSWIVIGPKGRFPYGSGADSSLTLTSSSTLALGANVLRLTSLSIESGWTLSHNASDYGIIIYCTTSCRLASSSSIRSNVGGKATGGVPPNGGGYGGDSGDASGAICVYAKSLTIHTSAKIGGGWPGSNGLAGNAPTGAAGGDSGANGTEKAMFMGRWSAAGGHAVGRAGARGHGDSGLHSGAAGGAGGAAAADTEGVLRTAYAVHRAIYGGNAYSNANFTQQDDLMCMSSPGGSGSGGSDNGTTINQYAEGGSGGGGGGYFGAGGNGGAETASGAFIGGVGATGGGGGGGGGAGGVVIVVCDACFGGGLISASGGTGGNGGDSYLAGTGPATGGGGGGGGGGGLAIFWGPADSDVSVLAAGGSGGIPGASVGGPASSLAGSSGGAGLVFDMRF